LFFAAFNKEPKYEQNLWKDYFHSNTRLTHFVEHVYFTEMDKVYLIKYHNLINELAEINHGKPDSNFKFGLIITFH